MVNFVQREASETTLVFRLFSKPNKGVFVGFSKVIMAWSGK